MSALVPSEDIERIVGARRRANRHLARAVSAEETVYILHSAECRGSGIDLRDCPFSLALDNGIRLDEWRQDVPVTVWVEGLGASARLVPVTDPECSACRPSDECSDILCRKSQRECGHHCNCVMIHDHCHWCLTEWVEDGREIDMAEIRELLGEIYTGEGVDIWLDGHNLALRGVPHHLIQDSVDGERRVREYIEALAGGVMG